MPIKNAPTAPNDGGYEKKTAPAKPEALAMSTHNDGGYEKRVVQESGTH